MRVPEPGRRQRDERGSLTLIAVVWSLIMLLLAALAIDGGLAISQRERAADIADQAARTEAQNLNQGILRSTGKAVIVDDGCVLAQSYVQSVAATVHDGTARALDCTYPNQITVPGPGGEGTVQPSEVIVQVELTYSPFVFDIFGGTLNVYQSGTAFAQAGD